MSIKRKNNLGLEKNNLSVDTGVCKTGFLQESTLKHVLLLPLDEHALFHVQYTPFQMMERKVQLRSAGEQRGFVNVCVHYVCRNVFSLSLSESACILN